MAGHISTYNDEGVNGQKSIIYDKRWYVYINSKKVLIRVGYYVEVSGSDGKMVLWEVLDDNVFE